MYLNFIQDRKTLGYQVLNDTACGLKLVLVTDSIVSKLLTPSKLKIKLTKIYRNRETVKIFVRKLPSNVKDKTKRILIVIVFGVAIWFTNIESCEGIGSSVKPQPASIIIMQPNPYQSVNTAPVVNKRLDKISFMPKKEIIPLIYLNAHQNVYINEKMLKRLRAGDLSSNLVLITIGVVVYVSIKLSGVDAFAIFQQFNNWNAPTVNPGFGLNPDYVSQPSRPQTSMQMEKPAVMPQQDYSSLTKSERRKLADPLGRDGSIEIDGYPRLDLRFNQVEYKTPKHGAAHGLPKDSKGKTAKSEANALALRDSLIDMPNKPNVIWYTDGMYQGGTPLGCDSVNLFDKDTDVIAVYQKQPNGDNLFLTTAKLTDSERSNLIATNGNFLTEKVLGEKKALSTKIQHPTITNNNNNNNGIQ